MPRSTTPSTKTAAVKAAASKKAKSEVVHEWEKKLPPYRKPEDVKRDKADKQPRKGSGLRAHPTKEGVWLNSMDVECNHQGIALSFLGAAQAMANKQREIEVLGHEAKDPVDVMRYGALDRSLPYGVRLEAAKGAAPYTNRKMPTAVDGGQNPNDPTGPGLPINIGDLKGLTDKELASLKALLEKTKSATE